MPLANHRSRQSRDWPVTLATRPMPLANHAGDSGHQAGGNPQGARTGSWQVTLDPAWCICSASSRVGARINGPARDIWGLGHRLLATGD
jgi:hypothetical protein